MDEAINETIQNTSEVIGGIKPDAETGNSIIQVLYDGIMTAVHYTASLILNFILQFFGLGPLTDAEVTLFLSIGALAIAIIKWRSIYGMLKVYSYAVIIILIGFILISIFGII